MSEPLGSTDAPQADPPPVLLEDLFATFGWSLDETPPSSYAKLQERRQAFLGQYPEHTAEIQAYFAEIDGMDQLMAAGGTSMAFCTAT